MWSILYLMFPLASASAFYLSSRHQRFYAIAWPRRLRLIAWMLLVLAWGVGERVLGLSGGGFAMLTAFMLAAVVLPYLDAWRSARKTERATQKESRHVG